MWKYKISQEFLDDFSNNSIHDTKTRNIETEALPLDIYNSQKTNSSNEIEKNSIIEVGCLCPACKRALEESEFQNRYVSDGQRVFICNICHYTNDPYKRTIIKKRNKIRKRKANSSSLLKESAAGNSNPNLTGFNPANQPAGRLDLGDDERVIPWNRIDTGFREEFDHQKQKKNFKYKLVKRKDEEGKTQFIRVRTRDTEGDAVQPSNAYTDQGRLKKEPRYNPSKNRNKNKSDGSWPHNRNPGTEGWYGQEYNGDNLDADMRFRVMTWDEYIDSRNQFMKNMTKPW